MPGGFAYQLIVARSFRVWLYPGEEVRPGFAILPGREKIRVPYLTLSEKWGPVFSLSIRKVKFCQGSPLFLLHSALGGEALLAARRPGYPLVFLQHHPAGAELAEIAFLVLAGDGEGAQDIVGVGLLQGPDATLAPGGVGNLPDRTRPDPGFPYPGNVCSCPGKSLPHYLSPRVLSRAWFQKSPDHLSEGALA